jgi:hypothetical protein
MGRHNEKMPSSKLAASASCPSRSFATFVPIACSRPTITAPPSPPPAAVAGGADAGASLHRLRRPTPPPRGDSLSFIGAAALALAARKVSGWPKRCKLAHAFLWECSDKRLKLAQLLGQPGVSLTRGAESAAALGCPAPTRPRGPPSRTSPAAAPRRYHHNPYRSQYSYHSERCGLWSCHLRPPLREQLALLGPRAQLAAEIYL